MIGIYIHVPFCACRCIYCDFYSTTSAHLKDAYLQALKREIDLRCNEYNDTRVRTIYIGGGTPSQLSPAQLNGLLEHLARTFQLDDDAEITIEANPDDVTTGWVQALRDTPVNRLSMGVQSFDDDMLRLLRRRHDSAGVLAAISRLRDAGFENLSIDLIYGLPGQTLEMWRHDLHKAIELKLLHLSAYALMIEEGTTLWKMRERGEVCETSDELQWQQYSMLMDETQRAGMLHYEISNFAMPGYESRHNSSYWYGIPYLGFGPGAHSYDGCGVRRWNNADLQHYITSVNTDAADDRWYENEYLTEKDRFNEHVFLALRTSGGLDLQELARQFGPVRVQQMMPMLNHHISTGNIQKTGENVRLTRSGIFVSDDVFSDLILD